MQDSFRVRGKERQTIIAARSCAGCNSAHKEK